MIYLRGTMWYTDVTRDGRRVRISTGCRDAKQAQVVAARIAAGEDLQPTGGKTAVGQAMTLKQALDRAWAEEWSGLKDKQMRRIHTAEILARFGVGVALKSITAAQVQQWATELTRGGNAPATVNRKLAVLGRVFRLARDRWGELDRAPPLPSLDEQEGRRDREPLTHAQVQALLATEPSDDLRGLFVVLLDTGARVGELLDLQWSEVRDDGARLVLMDRKAGDRLALPTTRRVQAELIRLKALGYEKPFPMSYEWYGLKFREACARAGITLARGTGLHVLRHTCATTLLERGVPIAAVQGMLGHSSSRTTEIYAKISGSHLRAAVKALEDHGGVTQGSAHCVETCDRSPERGDSEARRAAGGVAEWSNAPDSKSGQSFDESVG